jgi:hypothetical protein
MMHSRACETPGSGHFRDDFCKNYDKKAARGAMEGLICNYK